MMSVSDAVVDSIQVIWNTDPNHLLTKAVSSQPVPSVLEGFLTLAAWTFVPFFAEGAASRGDRSANYSGFRFPEGLEADEEPFEGVQMFDYYDKLLLSEPAFMRLMSRLFRALRTGAETTESDALGTDWWTDFERWAEQVDERAGA